MKDELYQFLAADYYATGEGRTVSVLITRAYPRASDYEDTFGGKLKKTPKEIAEREFVEEFGSYIAQGAEHLSRKDFYHKYGKYLPALVMKVLEHEEQPGNLHFVQSFHMNFS